MDPKLKVMLDELRAKTSRTDEENATLKSLEAIEKAAAPAEEAVTLDQVGKAVATAVAKEVKVALDGIAEILKAGKAPALQGDEAKGNKSSFREVLVGIKTRNQKLIDKYKLVPETKFFSGEEKVMTEGTPAAGGFLVPVEQSNQIINLIKEKSYIRKLAKIWPMASRTLTVPVTSNGVTAYWIDEANEKTADDPVFEQMTLTAYKLCCLTWASDELLADADPAVDAILYELFALGIMRAEETAFLQGTGGGGDPITGIYNYAGITTLPYSTDLMDDCADLIGAVEEDEGENVTILHALREKRKLRKMKDDDGQYIYQKPADKNTPATIWDAAAIGNKYIPTNLGVAANQSYMIAGDFSHAHIGDRQQIVIDSSMHRLFEFDKTVFRAVKRVAFRLDDASKFARLTGITLA